MTLAEELDFPNCLEEFNQDPPPPDIPMLSDDRGCLSFLPQMIGRAIAEAWHRDLLKALKDTK